AVPGYENDRHPAAAIQLAVDDHGVAERCLKLVAKVGRHYGSWRWNSLAATPSLRTSGTAAADDEPTLRVRRCLEEGEQQSANFCLARLTGVHTVGVDVAPIPYQAVRSRRGSV